MMRLVTREITGMKGRAGRAAAIAAVWLLSAACTDLVIDSLSVAPPAPTAGDAINITTVVENRGTPFGGGAGNSTLQVRITQGGATVSVDNRNVPDLRGGESHTEVIGTRLQQPGTYLVTAIADAFDVVGEGERENNNDAQLLLTVRPGVADLVVETLTPVPANPRTMESLEVVATIGNQGAAVVVPFRLRAELERDGYAQSANPQVAALGSGATIDVPLTFTGITEAGSYELTVTADYDNDVVDEADETNNTATAVIVVGPSHYWDLPIAAGAAHSCSDGFCWGRNDNGQLGNGSTTDSTVPAPVAVTLEMRGISAGGAHTCGKLGNAWRCWGANQRGQLGNGTTTDSPTPVAPSGISLNRLSAGAEHTCGISSSNDAMVGPVYCWGANQRGQLGNGTTTDSSVPVAVAGDLTFIAVSAGGEHTCGITSSGQGKCWGANDAGQLGDGSTTDSSVPVDVSAWSSLRFISAGARHSCGTFMEGNAMCWGSNRSGQLGNGSFGTAPQPTPQSVSGATDFWHAQQAISAGADHTCAIQRGPIGAVELKLFCWGGNAFGQLGVATSQTCDGGTPCATRAERVWDAGEVYSVGAGGFHTCAISAYGTQGRVAKCWGQNEDGALGSGGTADSASPVRVAEPQ